MALSMESVVGLALGAGLSDEAAVTAGAVAKAESGLRPEAHNPVPPDNSYGLWQINMIGNLGPARRSQFGIASNDELFDPAKNAHAMAIVSGGGANFGPWTTFPRASSAHMAEARAALANINHGTGGTGGIGPIPGVPGVIPDVSVPVPGAGIITSTADALRAIGSLIAHLLSVDFWKRFGLGIAGAGLLVAGVVVLNKDLIPSGAAAAALV